MDAAGERQKKSWQSFNNKVSKKKKQGVVCILFENSSYLQNTTIKIVYVYVRCTFQTLKSIFKTPKGNNGMVGVGTCGIGDQGMTANKEQARYNARHLAPNK